MSRRSLPETCFRSRPVPKNPCPKRRVFPLVQKAFRKATGVQLNWRIAPRRAGDVTAIWADPSLANRELGWRAERPIEETLAAAWAWEKRLAGK